MAKQTNEPNNSGRFSAPTNWNDPEPRQGEKPYTPPRHWDPWQNAQQNPQQNQWQGGQQYARQNPQRPQQDQWQNNGYDSRSAAGGEGPTLPQKRNTGLIIGVIVLFVLLMTASGLFTYFLMRVGCVGSEEKTVETTQPATKKVTDPPVTVTNPPVTTPPVTVADVPVAVTTPPVTEVPTEPTPEPKYPLYKNGRMVTSPKDLSMYDVVTFGSYPQGSLGGETPIRWYVIEKDGNKVRLISESVLDSRRFNDKNEKVAFQSSDLYRWLNSDFAEQAFGEDEFSMLSGPVSLLNKSEVERLLPAYLRKVSATEYAIQHGYGTSAGCWWLGEYSGVYFTNAHCAYCIDSTGGFNEIQINFNGKGIRPMIIIQF